MPRSLIRGVIRCRFDLSERALTRAKRALVKVGSGLHEMSIKFEIFTCPTLEFLLGEGPYRSVSPDMTCIGLIFINPERSLRFGGVSEARSDMRTVIGRHTIE